MLASLYWKYIAWRFDAGRLLAKATRGMEDARVLQIGSNDGRSGDPLYSIILHRVGWRAVFVEPIPWLFQSLRANYGDEQRFRFLNLAVSDRNGSLTLYYINIEKASKSYTGLPSWLARVATAEQGRLEKSFNGVFKDCVESIDVECVDGPELLRHGMLDRVDVLHIDAEGSDWLILKSLNLSVLRPKVVLFEHACLDSEQWHEALRSMKQSYRVRNIGRDFLCVLKS